MNFEYLRLPQTSFKPYTPPFLLEPPTDCPWLHHQANDKNAPTDRCRNLTALMPRCTKTSFLITPHYICAHRNSDNLHNAAFKGYSGRGMADEHLIVVLHQIEANGPKHLGGDPA